MGRGFHGVVGGILSLVDLIREHGEALEYELIRAGVRLRDCPSPGLDWRDVYVVAAHAGADSAIARSINGPDHEWTLTNQLLAGATDLLAWLQWSKTKDGARNQNQPKPIQRPGVDDGSIRHADVGTVEEIMAMTGVSL